MPQEEFREYVNLAVDLNNGITPFDKKKMKVRPREQQ